LACIYLDESFSILSLAKFASNNKKEVKSITSQVVTNKSKEGKKQIVMVVIGRLASHHQL